MTSVLADTIPGIRVVKAFAQEQREVERFRTANDRVFAGQLPRQRGVVVLRAGRQPADRAGFGRRVGLWLLASLSAATSRSASLIVFVALYHPLLRPDGFDEPHGGGRAAGRASAQRIFAILDRVPSVAEPVRPVHPGRLRGEVEFRGVGFHYGARPVLRGIDLKSQPGEMIGLVGPSGAGKTHDRQSRLPLLRRGRGRDPGRRRRYPLASRWPSIAATSASCCRSRFCFTARLPRTSPTAGPTPRGAEIVAAARAARAHEFILRLPDGYDSLVGERGQFLSGGERQRISIARALLIDPRILILDEATSSVDTETEREIQLALENLVQGRTTIAIAHRLSTLRRADRLVVVERGPITDVGPPSASCWTAAAPMPGSTAPV